MKIFQKLKISLYKLRAKHCTPPRFEHDGKSISLDLVKTDGTLMPHCYYDFKIKRWMCPLELTCIKPEEVAYWVKPYKERMFFYIDEEEEDSEGS